MSIYRLLVFVHVISGLLFVMAHGVSAMMMFAVSRERRLEKLCDYLEISRMAFLPAMRALDGVLISGVILTVWARWWQFGWIWASLVTFVGIGYVMGKYGAGYMNRVRRAIGIVSPKDLKKGVRPEIVPEPVLEQILREGQPKLVASVGLGGMAMIVLLMVVKPF